MELHLTKTQWNELIALIESYGIGYNTDSHADANTYLLGFLDSDDCPTTYSELFQLVRFTLETLT